MEFLAVVSEYFSAAVGAIFSCTVWPSFIVVNIEIVNALRGNFRQLVRTFPLLIMLRKAVPSISLTAILSSSKV